MGDQGLVMSGNVLIDGRKDGIVGKNVVATGVFELHTDVFPYLYRDGPFVELLVYLPNRQLLKTRPVELIRIKRCAYGDMTFARLGELPGFLTLFGKTAPGWIRVIDYKNIHNVEVEFVEHGFKCRIASEDVRVRIDGIQCDELLQLLAREGANVWRHPLPARYDCKRQQEREKKSLHQGSRHQGVRVVITSSVLSILSSSGFPVWTEQRRGTHSCPDASLQNGGCFVCVLSPLPTRVANQSNLWACTPVPTKVSRQLHQTGKDSIS